MKFHFIMRLQSYFLLCISLLFFIFRKCDSVLLKTSSVIDVSDFLEGNGAEPSWKLTQEALEFAVSQINRTRKTVYFPAGQYSVKDPIKLDFANIFEHTDENVDLLRSGVRFIGDNFASKIQMGNYENQVEPAFWITWSSPDGVGNQGVFEWEFSGLSFAGGTDHTLLKFGNARGNGVAWNSCIFKLNINNGMKKNDTQDSPRGDAVGVHIVWALQSFISIQSTCAKGIGVLLRSCEFNTISGSFSNTDSNALAPDGKKQITANRYSDINILIM